MTKLKDVKYFVGKMRQFAFSEVVSWIMDDTWFHLFIFTREAKRLEKLPYFRGTFSSPKYKSSRQTPLHHNRSNKDKLVKTLICLQKTFIFTWSRKKSAKWQKLSYRKSSSHMTRPLAPGHGTGRSPLPRDVMAWFPHTRGADCPAPLPQRRIQERTSCCPRISPPPQPPEKASLLHSTQHGNLTLQSNTCMVLT